MKPTTAGAIAGVAALAAGWLYLGWTTPAPSSDRCDGGVGDGCTVDTRVEITHFGGHFYGTGPERRTEWRVYDGLFWRRYVGPRSRFLATPGAVLVGDLP